MTNSFYYFELYNRQFDNHCLSLVITVTNSLLADAECKAYLIISVLQIWG